MSQLKDIKELLQKIRYSVGTMRADYIKALQDIIWDETEKRNEDLEQILSRLASDLNFYESDERNRDEALGYYGEEGLIKVIAGATEQIEPYLKTS